MCDGVVSAALVGSLGLGWQDLFLIPTLWVIAAQPPLSPQHRPLWLQLRSYWFLHYRFLSSQTQGWWLLPLCGGFEHVYKFSDIPTTKSCGAYVPFPSI